jgi:hypothetical protein
MCAGDVACDLGKRCISPAVELKPIIKNKHLMHFSMPRAHQTGSRLKGWSTPRSSIILAQPFYLAFNIMAGGAGQASLPTLLQPIGDTATEQIGSYIRCHVTIDFAPSRTQSGRLHCNKAGQFQA